MSKKDIFFVALPMSIVGVLLLLLPGFLLSLFNVPEGNLNYALRLLGVLLYYGYLALIQFVIEKIYIRDK